MAKNRPPSNRSTATVGSTSSSGCSSRSRKTCVPRSRPRIGISGWVATAISHTSESPMPMTTPASTPKTSVPRRATTAIQKSTFFTRNSRRISGTSIIPMTTASMINAPSTAFGRFENSGARNSSVSRTVTPDVREASPVFAPERSFSELADRLVETGIPWNSPAVMFARDWATDSWLMSIW